MNAAPTRYQLLPITLDDCLGKYHADIWSLWTKNLGITWPGRFAWLYQKNPLGPAKTWIAVEDQSRQVVGSASLYPREFLVGQKRVRAGGAIDISLEPSHRVFGPALALTRTVAAQAGAHGFELILAAPNQQALGVFRRAGYRRLGRLQRWVKFLSTRTLLRRHVRHSWLAALPAWMLDRGLRLADGLGRRLEGRPEWRAAGLPRADERFDALWQEAGSRSAAVSVKTAAYLNWRYADNAGSAHTFFCILDREEKRLHAFLVYTLRADAATVMDLLADGRASLETLLARFCAHMRGQGASQVVLAHLGGEELAASLRRLHFWPCGLARECYLCAPAVLAGGFERIWQPAAWSLFEGDLDV